MSKDLPSNLVPPCLFFDFLREKSEKIGVIRSFWLCDFKSVSLRRCETDKPPAMRVRIEGYTVITKKLQTSYNIGVQANCKTKGVKTMAQKAHSLSHTKWMCKYHIVFTPKYRRKIIYNQYRSSLGEIFHRLCQYKGVEIIEGHLMPDHSKYSTTNECS